MEERGRRRGRGLRTAAGWLVCAALLLPAPAFAQAEGSLASGGGSGTDRALRVADATFDVLCLRTSGLVTTLIGTAAFVPAVMMTAPGGLAPMHEALDHFVLTPGRYTFTRPLGEF